MTGRRRVKIKAPALPVAPDAGNETKIHNWPLYKTPPSAEINPVLLEIKSETMINPVTERNNPVTVWNNPVTERNNPVTERNNPVTERNNPVTERNNPVTERNNPVTERSRGAIQLFSCF